MGVTHVNRKGDTYHLLAGKTKTGKPKYYVSRKPGENAVQVEAVPEGYEIYESPADGAVHVRKIRPTKLTDLERVQVENGVRDATGKRCAVVEIDGDSFVVYWPDRNPAAAIFGKMLGFADPTRAELPGYLGLFTRYSPLLRFKLTDAVKRTFIAQRWCFRGSMEGWIHVSGAGSLEKLVAQCARHLGEESFFELF
jgi:hypothetical protein